MSTKARSAKLAPRRITRQVDRFAERRLRVALDGLLRHADCRPEPRTAWDDNARETPRAVYPGTKLRAMIHSAAAQGCTTPELVLSFSLSEIEDRLAQFRDAPPLEDLLFVRMAREQADAMCGQSLAYAIPSEEHRERAARLTEIAVTSGRVFCQLARQGRVLFPRQEG